MTIKLKEEKQTCNNCGEELRATNKKGICTNCYDAYKSQFNRDLTYMKYKSKTKKCKVCKVPLGGNNRTMLCRTHYVIAFWRTRVKRKNKPIVRIKHKGILICGNCAKKLEKTDIYTGQLCKKCYTRSLLKLRCSQCKLRIKENPKYLSRKILCKKCWNEKHYSGLSPQMKILWERYIRR